MLGWFLLLRRKRLNDAVIDIGPVDVRAHWVAGELGFPHARRELFNAAFLSVWSELGSDGHGFTGLDPGASACMEGAACCLLLPAAACCCQLLLLVCLLLLAAACVLAAAAAAIALRCPDRDGAQATHGALSLRRSNARLTRSTCRSRCRQSRHHSTLHAL